ncbi:EcsC family protein [Bacillus songklensis]|uniref:EcsC family protein n=1 Tax=Bacillus songklensis TaxID=1069116 RepID=A0ABV8B4X4_9BACI
MTIESRETLQAALAEIEVWEQDQKNLWFWERIGRLPFKLLDKITPAFIQNKIGVLLDELGSFIQTGGQYLTQERIILKRFEQMEGREELTISDISSMPLEKMDRVSKELKKSRAKIATVQGATTGFGGIFTLAVDIPMILGLSLKTLQEIAIAYGYDPRQKEERVFIVKCLQFVSADIVGKRAILEDLTRQYGNENRAQMISRLQGWREVVVTYTDSFGWKKLFQMIPIAGMFIGAFMNKSMMQDVAEAGIMLYRKRRILERLEKSDEHESLTL